MLLSFNLPHVFNSQASAVDNANALDILMSTLIALNVAHLERHAAVPLYVSGVRYGRTSEWEPIPALYARGFGDCKSLSAALIAERRIRGQYARPAFRFHELDYHILVFTGTGWEDPSRKLGMGTDEVAKFYPGQVIY